jgi:hypothetical protein
VKYLKTEKNVLRLRKCEIHGNYKKKTFGENKESGGGLLVKDRGDLGIIRLLYRRREREREKKEERERGREREKERE